MTRAAAARLLLGAAMLAGCGGSGSVRKQAEDVESVSAEGALLAHAAARGDSTTAFTRVHASGLRKRLLKLEPAIRHGRLARVARKAAVQLDRLEGRPGDETGAAEVETALERAADAAGEIGSSG